MKKLLFTILAVLMTASLGLHAQDVITNPNSVSVVYDKVNDKGSRIIFADEFLVSLDDNLEVTAHFGVLIPYGTGLDYSRYLWTFAIRVRYDNPEHWPDKDLTLPFSENDFVEIGSKESEYYRMDFLNASRDHGDGWRGASFEFDQDELVSFLKTSDATILCYTQGGMEGGPVVCVVSSRLKSATITSLLAILHRITD